MNPSLITHTKFFGPWEDDKEEAWLGEMARQGLHLVRPWYLARYTFVRGAPRNFVYRLDFVQTGKKDDAYFQLFRDAGWEHVSELGGWQYWRKEVQPGEPAEIFTDNESKIQKYQRLLTFLAILVLPLFMGIFSLRPAMMHPSTAWTEWIFAGVYIVYLILFLLYLIIFVRIWMRISQLKRH